MRMKIILAIMATVHQWSVMSGGEGTHLANIVFWSCQSRMTTYRYLNILEEIGYVKSVTKKYRGKPTRHYSITQAGKEYIGARNGH